jgi:[ribosomal protein S5]-alanine N-acetyltransferase
MTEAARAILGVAFRELNLHRVWATCHVRNHASYRVMEKLGMRREAHFRKNAFEKNEWRDSYLYAILAEEWLASGAGESLVSS